MRQCGPDEKCEGCATPFIIDAAKNLYGAYCGRCYQRHLACVMAFFVGLYEDAWKKNDMEIQEYWLDMGPAGGN